MMAFFRDKVGLEIGGPSSLFRWEGFPVYSVAGRIDNCNFGQQTIWEGAVSEGATYRFNQQRAPGNQYIAEATDLGRFAPSSYDFVLSSHTLEHVANPLLALSEFIRVLKDQGTLVLALPHKDAIFDHRRPVTSLSHLIQDYRQQVTESDLTHLEEIVSLHDLSMDPAAGDSEAFRQRSEKNVENRCLHHHVFNTRLAIEMLHYMGLQLLGAAVILPCDILLVAEKPLPGQQLQNDAFRGIGTAPCWTSPFPSDQTISEASERLRVPEQ